ncbi:MAG: GCN5-related N-acetyltransferase [Akkermansiaceae bacterium]|nr:GCN5-related N-acetyltransferase [Akkermansiaceae bacterium]
MIFRRILPGEALAYREIRLRALQDSPGAFLARYEDAILRTPESWEAQAEQGAEGSDRAIFLAIGEGAEPPVGLAALYRDAEPPGSTTGELIQVWVTPEQRGKGVAEGLIAHLLDWARGQGFIVVRAEVTPENGRALRFYQRGGFTVEPPIEPGGDLPIWKEL